MPNFKKQLSWANIVTAIAALFTIVSYFVFDYAVDRHGTYNYKEFCDLSKDNVGTVFLVVGIVGAALAALFALCKLNALSLTSAIIILLANETVVGMTIDEANAHHATDQVLDGAYIMSIATFVTFVFAIVACVKNSKAKKSFYRGNMNGFVPMGHPQFAQPQMGQPMHPQFGQAPQYAQPMQQFAQPQFVQAPQQFAPVQPQVTPAAPVVEPSPVVTPVDEDDEKTTLLQ